MNLGGKKMYILKDVDGREVMGSFGFLEGIELSIAAGYHLDLLWDESVNIIPKLTLYMGTKEIFNPKEYFLGQLLYIGTDIKGTDIKLSEK
jgi:hypothetical protein